MSFVKHIFGKGKKHKGEDDGELDIDEVADESGEPIALPEAEPSDPNDKSGEVVEENAEDRKKMVKSLSALIGKDVTSLMSLPVSLFEPLSVLQSMCEPLEYAGILDVTCQTEDPIDRICMVGIFCVAFFSNYVRTLKPFNPVLGETFEFVAPDGSFRTLAEQVCHHPPIGVVETVSANWTLQQESKIETKLWGNSVDIFSVGANHLKLHKTNDHYVWNNPTSCVHNIILGSMWIERYGLASVKDVNGGIVFDINFKKAGWFEGIQHTITGEVRDSHGKVRAILTGKWNQQVTIQKVDDQGHKGEPRCLWQKPKPQPVNKWKWSKYLHDLTALDATYQQILPETDSRLRGDLRALQALNNKLASKEKHRIEERERLKRRERVGQEWTAKYFKKVPDAKFDHVWQYGGKYWEEREARIQAFKQGGSVIPPSPPEPLNSDR